MPPLPIRNCEHLSDQADTARASIRPSGADDRTDSTRAASPLTIPPGAVYIDTTALEIPDVVRQVLDLVEAKLTVA